MKISLAPMEGVVDFTMRNVLTRVGGYDHCVTEFVRVTNLLLPARVFKRFCPELNNNSKTPAGTPIRIQLLGSNPDAMAENAYRATELGSPGIDINFGCPSKTVNRSDGGSILLKTPNRVFDIVSAIRKKLPAEQPVSAKLRLGYEDKSLFLENALAAIEGGASEITVHARSKVDGYKPPAHWEYIAKIREAVSVPVIANGDIWSVDDYWRCREITGCEHVMIGRGALRKPGLARDIKKSIANEEPQPHNWTDITELLLSFCDLTATHYKSQYIANRIKQWTSFLKKTYPEAETLFKSIKRLNEPEEIYNALRNG